MSFDLEILKKQIYPIVGAVYSVHTELGPGLNEYVYQEGLEMQLELENISFEREKEFCPTYQNRPMKAKYRLDFVCANNIIVECKSVEQLNMNHRAQLFNYMRLTKMPMGVLVNFASRSAVVERYFYNSQKNEIISIDGSVLTKYTQQ